MVLGITEDFSVQVDLDSELTEIPSNGIYLNSAVHPLITLENLLNFLPIKDFTFDTYDNSKTYLPFEQSRNSKKSIVEDGGKLYQCILESTGNAVSDSTYWLETNIESLRLKSFIYKVKDRVNSDLSLESRLIDNQYIYEIGENKTLPEGDYFGWAIEPKNSDYVRLCLNEIAIQNDVAGPVDVYVVNQGVLIDTIQVDGGNKKVKFERTDYNFFGKGAFYFLIDSQDVYRYDSTVDWLRYDGFVAYPVTATGNNWDVLEVTPNISTNGIGLNVSAYLDSDVYVLNNLKHLASYVRSTFEYMSFQLFAQNANSRRNSDVREQMDSKIIMAELKSTETDTVLKRYLKQRKESFISIQKTFDAHLLNDNDELTVTVSSV